MPADPLVTVSVVSHRQNALVNLFAADLARHCATRVALVVTENVADPVGLELPFDASHCTVLGNAAPLGFGANHNAAFAHCRTDYYCVANPDLRLAQDPFPPLLDVLADPRTGAAAPLVRSPRGAIEDSARRFPTVASLVRKAFGGATGAEYPADRGALEVDWVAGMFILFPAPVYRALGGFDEGYFLYYEDVDLCRRLRAAGRRVIYDPRAEVIHDARRASRRDWRLARHHLQSALRYLRGGAR